MVGLLIAVVSSLQPTPVEDPMAPSRGADGNGYTRATMAADRNVKLQYRKASPPGAGQYDVLYEGHVIGRVGRFRMSAGQFGSSWVATTPRRARSVKYTTRDAAAAWLLEQARSNESS
jgi:hypothetical protein